MIAHDTDWEKCISIYGTIGRQMLKKKQHCGGFPLLIELI